MTLQIDIRTERRVELVLQKTGRLVTANPSLRLSLSPYGEVCYINYADQFIELGRMLLERPSHTIGEFMVLAKGALYHELGHWMFSVHHGFRKTLTTDELRIYRALEDCRIETWFALKYKKAVDYFYLLYLNLIWDNPDNFSVGYVDIPQGLEFEKEASSFLLTYGRKFLPIDVMKRVLKYKWVTSELKKKVDRYIQLDFLKPGNWIEAHKILKWMAKFFKKHGTSLFHIENTGPDKNRDVEGAKESEQRNATGDKERAVLQDIIIEGVKEQNKKLNKELKKDKQKEEEEKARQAQAETKEAEEEAESNMNGEEEKEEPSKEIDDGEGAGSGSQEKKEESGKSENEGENGEAGEESGEGKSEEGSGEEGNADGEDNPTRTDSNTKGAGTEEGGEYKDGSDASEAEEQPEFERLWEEIEERCIIESMEEIHNYKHTPQTQPDKTPAGIDGHKGKMSDGEVAKKSLELAKYLKGLESLDVKEKKRKRHGLIDNARLHDYRRTNRIFKRRQLTFGDIINLGILVDTSGSMGRWIPDVIDAARILYRAGASCKHRIAVRAFASKRQLLFQGFFNPGARWKEDTPVVVRGGTQIYGALADFAADFSCCRGKNVLFIISDGDISRGLAPEDFILSAGQDRMKAFASPMDGLVSEFRASDVDVQFIKVAASSKRKSALETWFAATKIIPNKKENWFNEAVIEVLRKFTVGSL